MKHIGIIFFLTIAASLTVSAQRVAVIEPERQSQIEGLADSVRTELQAKFRVLDASLVDAAYRSIESENYFNLTTEEARRIGAVVGSDTFVLLRSTVQRRESLDQPAYFEAYAVVHVVSSRTGRMIDWFLERAEADLETEAAGNLHLKARAIAERIRTGILTTKQADAQEKDAKFESVPPENSPLSKDLKTPIPYRRIRPEYTRDAYLYSIKATIDIEVDLDAEGQIKRTSIERWAGFGLEGSVEKAVRSMNWRPAMRGGKPLPMRVLLRYNFTKIEKDEAP